MARINGANALAAIGDAAEALARLRALRRDLVADLSLGQCIASLANYADDEDRDRMLAEHVTFGRMIAAETSAPHPEWPNPPEPERRLRVGFLSPDLHAHSVASFLEGLLGTPGRRGFETVAISTGHRVDETTERLRRASDSWVSAWGMDDEGLVRELRRLRLDVLVELSGLSDGSRLQALARRAAPVQVTAIGYPNTTGIAAIDWRLVDATTDPPGSERIATERLMRLEGCFLCYRPPDEAPAVAPPHRSRPITFGSFNSIKKITPGGCGSGRASCSRCRGPGWW